MNSHCRIVGVLWLIVGATLATLVVWGLMTQDHSRSVVTSWLVALGFSALALRAGATFAHSKLIGRILVRIVSVIVLLYAVVWLFLGGVEDASNYAVPLCALSALSIYSLFVARGSPFVPNKTIEPTR